MSRPAEQPTALLLSLASQFARFWLALRFELYRARFRWGLVLGWSAAMLLNAILYGGLFRTHTLPAAVWEALKQLL